MSFVGSILEAFGIGGGGGAPAPASLPPAPEALSGAPVADRAQRQAQKAFASGVTPSGNAASDLLGGTAGTKRKNSDRTVLG